MRIPVLEHAGLRVCRSGCTEQEFRRVLEETDPLGAVILSNDEQLLQSGVISTARALCTAPLIYFRDPVCFCDASDVDLIVPTLTSPSMWLPNVLEAIEVSRRIRESSRQLREDCQSVRAKVRREVARAIHERSRSIDLDAIWRNDLCTRSFG
jgi:hypothetical protein